MQQLSIFIGGRVQGVFFRKGAKEEADRLGLVGLARNLSNGDVEIVAEGEEKNLREFLDWCCRGTKLAKVERLSFRWARTSGAFSGFEIEREGSCLKDKVQAFQNFSLHLFRAGELPRHVVIIPDGNRRWAKENRLEIFRGHERGVGNTLDLMEELYRLRVPYVTFWGFSTENWRRGAGEVRFLMDLFRAALARFRERFLAREVRFHHFGRKDRLPADVAASLDSLKRETEGFSERHFGLALDYGGRDEILRAISRINPLRHPPAGGAGGGRELEITENEFSKLLDTSDFPDPDLIIRTSGERRTSGLMPWQGAYAELHFSTRLFPDFGVADLREAIADFAARRRRFGT